MGGALFAVVAIPFPGSDCRGKMSDMSAEHDNDASLTIFDLFANLVADDDAAAMREVYCEVVATQIKEVASWLAFDAFIGAGDQNEQGSVGTTALAGSSSNWGKLSLPCPHRR